jgi:hypothetical protein
MDMSHDHTDFGLQIPFLGSGAYFCIFDPQKYIFTHSIYNSRSMDMSHDHTDFGPQTQFLGSGSLFSPFWPPKVDFFLLHVKFPIDGHVTRPYWFWAPNSIFGLWEPIFAFLTPKSIVFLAPYKIPERWIYHTTILILRPKLSFWALGAYFRPPKVYFFLLHVKFPIDGHVTRPYWFWAPNSVFGLWEPIFAFLTSNIIVFLAPFFIYIQLRIDWWVTPMTYVILSPPA